MSQALETSREPSFTAVSMDSRHQQRREPQLGSVPSPRCAQPGFHRFHTPIGLPGSQPFGCLLANEEQKRNKNLLFFLFFFFLFLQKQEKLLLGMLNTEVGLSHARIIMWRLIKATHFLLYSL